MSAEEPTLPGLLAEHRFNGGEDMYGDWFNLCICGDKDPHTEHVAQVVLAWITERLNDPDVVEAIAMALHEPEPANRYNRWDGLERRHPGRGRDNWRNDAKGALAAALIALGVES